MKSYNHDTPYTVQSMKTVEGNLRSFDRALATLPTPKLIVEAMGGIGNQTRILQKRFPGVELRVWERDFECVEKLRKIEGIEAFNSDFPIDMKCPEGSLLILDFNMFTLLHLDRFDHCFRAGADWIVLTDCARGKLATNWKSYKIDRPSFDDYLAAVGNKLQERYGYSLRGSEAAPRSLTYLIAQR